MPRTLEHLRFLVNQSRGRRYPEPPHPYRSDFQRDRDRIVHARAFRRLEYKTQVFSAGLSDHFRNRLTHTIEVTQIARTVAGVLGLDSDLTEALALAHDIGHPPFAHAGEVELNRQMSRFGDGFDHNRHALRIVENFEQRYARFPGLNLTFEVREGIVKHSADLVPGEEPTLDEYCPELRPPLEGQIIDLADEIAYNTADLDDGYAAGMFSLSDIAHEIPQYAAFLEQVEMHYPGASERVQFHEVHRLLIDWLVSGLIEGIDQALTEAAVQTVEAIREHPIRLARMTETTQKTCSELKVFLHRRVYGSPGLAAERERSARMVAGLFQFYLDHPDQMPPPYDASAAEQPSHRVVCDYIAGMTDPFFLRTYRGLLEATATPNPQSG